MYTWQYQRAYSFSLCAPHPPIRKHGFVEARRPRITAIFGTVDLVVQSTKSQERQPIVYGKTRDEGCSMQATLASAPHSSAQQCVLGFGVPAIFICFRSVQPSRAATGCAMTAPLLGQRRLFWRCFPRAVGCGTKFGAAWNVHLQKLEAHGMKFEPPPPPGGTTANRCAPTTGIQHKHNQTTDLWREIQEGHSRPTEATGRPNFEGKEEKGIDRRLSRWRNMNLLGPDRGYLVQVVAGWV